MSSHIQILFFYTILKITTDTQSCLLSLHYLDIQNIEKVCISRGTSHCLLHPGNRFLGFRIVPRASLPRKAALKVGGSGVNLNQLL